MRISFVKDNTDFSICFITDTTPCVVLIDGTTKLGLFDKLHCISNTRI